MTLLICLAGCASQKNGDNRLDYSDRSTPTAEARAQADVAQAEIVYRAATELVIPHSACGPSITKWELSYLQQSGRSADRYVAEALEISDPGDRGVMLDVAGLLHGLVVDGYMVLGEKLDAAGCRPQARWLYSEVLNVYQGEAFAAARLKAQTALNRLG